MAEKRVADVVANWYWDDRHKRWTVTIRGSEGRQFRRVETTSPMGYPEMQLMLDSIRREMESWLA